MTTQRAGRHWWRTGSIGVLTAALVATVTLLGAPRSHADLLNPRQEWLRNSQAALFLHWGMRTSPGFTSCSAWESAVTGGGWRPEYWIQEAQKLHAQYVTLASFHSRLGYARAWPSRIPGSCTTRRDFLGELIAAGKARGVKVLLYMTDDPKWFAEGRTSGSWLNSSAYSAHKGRTVDLHTRPGFGEYSYDQFFEVMDRYPDLAGFWIDNDNEFWEARNLYRQIHQRKPHMILSDNNEDKADMDMISNEQKSGMTPGYDYPQAVYTPQPRITEACFTIAGRWWYTGGNPTPDRRMTTGRTIANAGASVKSHIAEGAMVNGRFPSNQEAFNNWYSGWMRPIAESYLRTEGGGYMYGGFTGGSWNDGAHGATTISKANPNLHYIHVLTRPSGSTLRLRDNGYDVTRVTNLRTGGTVSFSQGGGNLTLTGLTTWDQYDTVFRVETAGRVGIHPRGSVSATATASRGGFPAANLVDGDYLKYWDNNGSLAVSITLDLGSSKRIEYLGVNQREWSVSYARSATEQSARIRAYRVFVSGNGTSWGSPVRSGTMRSAKGAQFIDVNTSARYVRLTVDSTWAASSATRFARQLRIDELWVGSGYPS